MKTSLNWICIVMLIAAIKQATTKRIHLSWLTGTDTRDVPSIDNRIVGGQVAAEGEAPYQVSIQNLFGTNICGGVIISERWILTAGHCMLDYRIEDLRIIVGTNNRTAPGQVLRPELSVVHCMYDIPAIYNNDIAVVRLNDTIKFNAYTQKIELSREDPPAGAQVTLTGWGSLQINNPAPDLLYRIDLRVIDLDECRLRWNNSTGVDIGHICTFTQENEGACGGDSGGPLVWEGKLVGLVNWGAPCAVGKPDMHANTIYYLDWINRAISQCKTERN